MPSFSSRMRSHNSVSVTGIAVDGSGNTEILIGLIVGDFQLDLRSQ